MPRPERRMLEELVYQRLRRSIEPGLGLDIADELGGYPGLGNAELEERALARKVVRRAWRRIGMDLLELMPPAEDVT